VLCSFFSLLEQIPKINFRNGGSTEDSGKARRQANPHRAWPADATQPEIQEGAGGRFSPLRASLSQAIPMEVLGRRPGRNRPSAVSELPGQGRATLTWWLFLADRPFRLGHLEISFGICSYIDAARGFR
jgi:hypothetical protein